MKASDSLVDYFHSNEQCLAKEVLKTEKYKVKPNIIEIKKRKRFHHI